MPPKSEGLTAYRYGSAFVDNIPYYSNPDKYKPERIHADFRGKRHDFSVDNPPERGYNENTKRRCR